jgi:hypothetical protein
LLKTRHLSVKPSRFLDSSRYFCFKRVPFFKVVIAVCVETCDSLNRGPQNCGSLPHSLTPSLPPHSLPSSLPAGWLSGSLTRSVRAYGAPADGALLSGPEPGASDRDYDRDCGYDCEAEGEGGDGFCGEGGGDEGDEGGSSAKTPAPPSLAVSADRRFYVPGFPELKKLLLWQAA